MVTDIRDFYGKKLGSVDTDDKGNKIVRDFYGRIVSYYDADQDVTRDFYRRIIGRGDIAVSLLYNNK